MSQRPITRVDVYASLGQPGEPFRARDPGLPEPFARQAAEIAHRRGYEDGWRTCRQAVLSRLDRTHPEVAEIVRLTCPERDAG